MSRKDFDAILAEQKLQNSGLLGPAKAVKIGKITGVQAIVAGRVGSITSQDSYFFEKHTHCLDKECHKTIAEDVRCMKRIVGLAAEIRIVDVERSEVIYANAWHKKKTFKHCIDDGDALPSATMVAQDLASVIAGDFVYKLTPHYRTFEVELLDEPDLDYTEQEERLLEASLKYIEQKRYDKAQSLLARLVDLTGQKSYVPLYNLGVIQEVQGNFERAREYYKHADNLMIEPVDEINEAVVRIENLIANKKKSLEQINR